MAGNIDGSGAGPSPDGQTNVPGKDAGAVNGLLPVSFRYEPGWEGVKEAYVHVGPADLMNAKKWPQATKLAADGNGWAGTVMLAPGKYAYVFRVAGDPSYGDKFTTSVMALDNGNSAIVPCPKGSPTYFDLPDPAKGGQACSAVTVPVKAPPPRPFHLTGRLTAFGKPALGWLVGIDREDQGLHHTFSNRITTGADGTFDLSAAPGHYSVGAMNPKEHMFKDADHKPLMESWVRYAFTGIDVSADAELDPLDVGVDYSTFKPQPSSKVPLTFTFAPPADARAYAPGVYSGGNLAYCLWGSMKYDTTTSVPWDGTFNCNGAAGMAQPGDDYFWGVIMFYADKPQTGAWYGYSLGVALKIQ